MWKNNFKIAEKLYQKKDSQIQELKKRIKELEKK